MTRRRSRRGRPVQPLPQRRSTFLPRLLVALVGIALILGFAVLTFSGGR